MGADLWFRIEDVAGSVEIQAERFTQTVVKRLPRPMPHAASPAYRGRFAPSPTGDLHFGSLLAALGSWLLARHANGSWLVRVEDVDPPREVAGASRRQPSGRSRCSNVRARTSLSA